MLQNLRPAAVPAPLPARVPAPAARPSYARHALGWTKRRARRIQRGYGVPRRVAVTHALLDYLLFTAPRDARITKLTRQLTASANDAFYAPAANNH